MCNGLYLDIINIEALMHVQNLIKIIQLIHTVFNINKILTLIKGHNFVENQRKIKFNCPNLHNFLSKFIQLFWRYWGKNTFFT